MSAFRMCETAAARLELGRRGSGERRPLSTRYCRSHVRARTSGFDGSRRPIATKPPDGRRRSHYRSIDHPRSRTGHLGLVRWSRFSISDASFRENTIGNRFRKSQPVVGCLRMQSPAAPNHVPFREKLARGGTTIQPRKTMQIERLNHVQLAMPADGEDAARRIYEGVLGIPEVAKPPHLAKRGGCWFERGALKVHL